ncbi:MAG: glycosyltransferase [Halodesulfurarchaeum sp.]
MRLALVSPTTVHHRDPGAVAFRLHRLATAVTERGHEVVWITRKWWQGEFQDFEQGGITYRGIGDGSGDSILTPLRVASVLRKTGAGIVHVGCESPRWTMGAQLGATLSGAGFLLEWYDPPDAEGTLDGWLRTHTLRSADVVVTPSQTVETAVRERGIDGRRIRVIPTGIDVDLIRETPPAESGDIVYSRRLDDGANLETLLLALAEFREFDWNATIIGDGPRREAYERQATDLRIDDRVEFMGELPLEERIARFKAAHVYVHTAEYTPFAHDLLRALACGCVSIVEYHEDSSAHELVVHEDRGFTATSPEELTRRLAAAGDLESTTVEEDFLDLSEEAFLEAYLDVYRSIRA